MTPTTTHYSYYISIGAHNPGNSTPPTLPAAGEFLEVRVVFLHSLVRPHSEPPEEVVPTRTLKTTLLAPRQEFFSLGRTCIANVLNGMGAVGLPDMLIDSVGHEMLSFSLSIAANPSLAAARLLTFRLYVVAKTMPLASVLAAEARRRANAYVDTLENVIVMAGDHYDQCSICLEDFGVTAATTLDDFGDDDYYDDGDDSVVRTPCGHMYHKACIAEWLRTSPLCPLCRYSMPIAESCDC